MYPDIIHLQEARVVENNNLLVVDSVNPIHFCNRTWVYGFIMSV